VVEGYKKGGKHETIIDSDISDAENPEIPMKGKKVSPNDIKFNRIAPKQNQAKRRETNSSSSSDEENAAAACYGSPVLKQH